MPARFGMVGACDSLLYASTALATFARALLHLLGHTSHRWVHHTTSH